MQFSKDTTPPTPEAASVRPIVTGWALQLSALIDRESPGFLVGLLQTHGTKRHVMFAVMAVALGNWVDEFPDPETLTEQQRAALKRLGETLPEGKLRDALACAFDIPERFEGLGVLGRLVEPLEPLDYVHLMEVFCDPEERPRQQVIQHVPRIDGDRLRGLLTLDPTLCSVALARKIRTADDARHANNVLAIVRRHRPDLGSKEIGEFLRQDDQLASFGGQLERLLGLVKELPPLTTPIPEGFKHLRTWEDFKDCGRRFRNCLSSKFLDSALPQRVVFLEFLPDPAIATLIPTNQGLLLACVYAPRNAPPTPTLVSQVRDRLQAGGIGFITPTSPGPEYDSARYILMQNDPFALTEHILD